MLFFYFIIDKMSVEYDIDHKQSEVMMRRRGVVTEIMTVALQLFAPKGYLKEKTQDIVDKYRKS